MCRDSSGLPSAGFLCCNTVAWRERDRERETCSLEGNFDIEVIKSVSLSLTLAILVVLQLHDKVIKLMI